MPDLFRGVAIFGREKMKKDEAIPTNSLEGAQQ